MYTGVKEYWWIDEILQRDRVNDTQLCSIVNLWCSRLAYFGLLRLGSGGGGGGVDSDLKNVKKAFVLFV